MPLAELIGAYANTTRIQNDCLRQQLAAYLECGDALTRFADDIEGGTDIGMAYRNLELALTEGANIARQCRRAVQREKFQAGAPPIKQDPFSSDDTGGE